MSSDESAYSDDSVLDMEEVSRHKNNDNNDNDTCDTTVQIVLTMRELISHHL